MDETQGGGRLSQMYQNLSERERKLLVLWGFAMGFIALFLIGNFAWSSLDDLDTRLVEHQEALELISSRQARYLQAKGATGDSVEAKLNNNDLRLTTFLDKEATRYEVKITSFKDGSNPVGAKKGSKDTAAAAGLTEEWATVTIEGVEYGKLIRFIDALAASKEIIVLKRIDITRPRRGKEADKVEATLTVSTFKRKKQES